MTAAVRRPPWSCDLTSDGVNPLSAHSTFLLRPAALGGGVMSAWRGQRGRAAVQMDVI